jgi:type I restriction enzyme S subunit
MTARWRECVIGEIIQLEYGKPLDDIDRKANGRFPVYGANGEKDRSDKFFYDKASIIVGRKGSAGEINLTEAQFWPLDVTYFVTFDEGQHDLQFVYYLLKSLDLTKLAKGVKPGINRNDVYSKRVRIPPLQEQKHVATRLNSAFAEIASAERDAEQNIKNARGLFDSKVDSLVNDISAEAPSKTLREIAIDFGRGKSKHRPRNDPKLYDGAYPFIQTGDVRNSDHLITEYTQTYNDAGLAQSKLWPRGTLCITIAANIAETGILSFDACFPDSVIGVIVDERQTSVKYLEYMLQTVKSRLKARGKGSAQDNINLTTFENERFPFPSIPTQARIVKQLDQLSAETQHLEELYRRKLSLLDDLKRSFLQMELSDTRPSKRDARDILERVA